MIALGHWRAVTIDGSPAWGLPEGATHALDLRRVPDQASDAAPLPSLFWFAGSPPRSARPIANALDDRLASADLAALADAAGVASWTSTPDTLDRALRMIFGDRTSIDPAATPRPLVPTTQRQIELCLGPQQTSEAFEWGRSDHTGILRANLKDQVARQWQAAANERERDHLRKRVDYLNAKYPGSAWREFVKTSIRQEFGQPVPRETTLADTFTAANGTVVYAHSGGGFSWVEVRPLGNDPTIQTNRVVFAGSSAHYARAEANLSGDDMLVECLNCTVENTSAAAVAACVRVDNNTLPTVNHYVFYRGGSGNNVFLFKRVNGSTTILATTSAVGVIGERIACSVDGSDLKGFRNFVETLSVTDTSVVGFLKSGFAGAAGVTGSTFMDDWQAADLSVSAPWLFYHSLRRGKR